MSVKALFIRPALVCNYCNLLCEEFLQYKVWCSTDQTAMIELPPHLGV